jgi:hypothetical protein
VTGTDALCCGTDDERAEAGADRIAVHPVASEAIAAHATAAHNREPG